MDVFNNKHSVLVAVIDYAPNCPIHDPWLYSGLRWFDSVFKMLHWIKESTKCGFFIKEVYDTEKHERLDFKINYLKATHSYIGAEVLLKGVKLAHVKQNPYGDEKEWVIEKYDALADFSLFGDIAGVENESQNS